MKAQTKVAIACIVVISSLALLSLRIEKMGSGSMEPVIRGAGSPPTREGDTLLILKRPFYWKVGKGHLVSVQLPSPVDTVTVRRISSVVTKDGAEEYALEAAAPDGLDSRHFGSVGAEKILGRVLKIMK